MDWKTRIINNLRSASSDKEALNRNILKWHKSLKEAEQVLNRGRGGKKG